MKRFGLSKSERIKKKNEISRVFNSGKRIYSNSRKLKAIFCFGEDDSGTIKIVPAVYKKTGNAVWRNRVKRLFRESYRLNKNILIDIIDEKTLLLMISPNSINKKKYPHIVLNDVQDDVIDLLDKIKNQILTQREKTGNL
ncbi:MAG: ribonuclease P protein component [Melioribacteraceae bacterium]|nr:ribonuclease P protein component [Melioribacteraceae bacterium]